MHPRNRYQGHYDLLALSELEPRLTQWLVHSPIGKLTLNFSQPQAVELLNKALLKFWYQIEWSLPTGNLCPAIPGRADYIHYLADLLAKDTAHYRGPQVNLLDIGCGANCIYPILGSAEYGWRFTGSDIQSISIQAAQHIIARNAGLASQIRLRRQKQPSAIFDGIIQTKDRFHATLCNPPFHDSAAQAASASLRKNRNLGYQQVEQLNFAGQYHELWCPGGEERFIHQMVEESVDYQHQVLWFTVLVSKKRSLDSLKTALHRLDVPVIQQIEMSQGSKQSRLLIWSFKNQAARKRWLAAG